MAVSLIFPRRRTWSSAQTAALLSSAALTQGLMRQRLERAIGVIYRPDTERESHYFHAALPQQFDEYLWFDATQAVTPLKTRALEGLPDTYPFGL